MNISSHAGHGAVDSKSQGATTKLLQESKANREVNKELIAILKEQNEVKNVYNDTVDYPASKSDCINKLVANINSHNVDYSISIHFNSGRNDLTGDKSIGGFEVLLNNNNGSKVSVAKRMCANMEKLGFRNRGVKINSDLGVLKCKPQALLAEICFVDDKDDVNLYNSLGAKAVAKALAEAILNRPITSAPSEPSKPSSAKETYYRVVTSSHKSKSLAQEELEKVKKAGFKDAFLTAYEK